ncbi:MAG TPA: anthranilate synthase component I family protein [Pirellulales bacterium]|jgi:para-aminobenzoate synthetase component 1|nr:anthranilate synthase component I family protein [Pirellulales bacterium]
MIRQSDRGPELRAEPSALDHWAGVVIPLQAAPDPADAFRRLSRWPHCIFFDSAMVEPHLGRYSFIAADPFELLVAKPEDVSSWDRIQRRLNQFAAPTLPDLPPFQGGVAGLFAYDLSHSLERLPRPRFDEFCIPALTLGVYDVVLAYDHETEQAWIISQGFPEQDPQLRYRRAKSRAAEMQRLLADDHVAVSLRDTKRVSEKLAYLSSRKPIANQYPVGNIAGLSSNFSQADYLAMVRRGIEYVYAGDVFQVNLAQRLLHPAVDDSVSLYFRLRERNPAPFAAYFDLGEFQIISASPERFLQVQNRQVEARPIKGTRARSAQSQADEHAAADLLSSEKDRAENVMIVDLLRNDLSRVCQPESVTVSELCRLERYAYVQHLVSVVQGTLFENCGPLDLLRAAFPGGSVTGAPKVRAMEIIAELEPTARGAYCGALGYLGFDGAMDSSILIRTITAGRGWWQLPVGGGIVSHSDPQREYEETWAKAEGLLRALK